MKAVIQTKHACAFVLLVSATLCRADLVLDTGTQSEPPAPVDLQELVTDQGEPRILATPVIPEPSTIIGGALLLAPFAFAAVRKLRR